MNTLKWRFLLFGQKLKVGLVELITQYEGQALQESCFGKSN